MAEPTQAPDNSLLRVISGEVWYRERIALPLMRLWAMGRGSIRSMPFAGGWTSSRDLPTPPSRSFLDQYARTKKGGRR